MPSNNFQREWSGGVQCGLKEGFGSDQGRDRPTAIWWVSSNFFFSVPRDLHGACFCLVGTSVVPGKGIYRSQNHRRIECVDTLALYSLVLLIRWFCEHTCDSKCKSKRPQTGTYLKWCSSTEHLAASFLTHWWPQFELNGNFWTVSEKLFLLAWIKVLHTAHGRYC